MKKILVGLCDDQPFYLEELYALVYACANESRLDFEISTFADISELLKQMEGKEIMYDMLFLDVEMPQITGVEAAKTLREKGYDGIICFVTSHDKYALEAYGVEALGYLVKPAKYEDVKRLIKKAVVQIFYKFSAEEAEKRYLEVNTQKGIVQIDMNQILYIEKRRNQCVFHLEDGEIVCYETLKNVFHRLNHVKFCYTHQGFIVNFDKVKEIQQDIIALGEGREIPVSRKFYKIVKERKRNEIRYVKDRILAE